MDGTCPQAPGAVTHVPDFASFDPMLRVLTLPSLGPPRQSEHSMRRLRLAGVGIDQGSMRFRTASFGFAYLFRRFCDVRTPHVEPQRMSQPIVRAVMSHRVV
ncbi:MAG: hypothetical protein QOF84_6354 [Streptomyces sp.]|jgi:hypothetical protein|nr:hypothetical protein [Streptomyces sp.]